MAERVTIIGNSSHPSRMVEDPDAIDNPILSFFLDYWRSRRGDEKLPRTDTFKPREIGQHLPWVVLADALPDYQDFRYRLVGTRVSEYFLADGTGKTVREAFAGLKPGDLEGVVWLYRQPCVTQVPLRFTAPGGRVNGVYFPDYDAGYFPFSTDGNRADRVVNVFTFNYRKFLETRSLRSLVHHE